MIFISRIMGMVVFIFFSIAWLLDQVTYHTNTMPTLLINIFSTSKSFKELNIGSVYARYGANVIILTIFF